MKIGSIVSTPHSAGRLYRVVGLEEYANPAYGSRALIEEIGSGAGPIGYPLALLKYEGFYG